MKKKYEIIPVSHIERRILMLRGQKSIVGADLAGLYGVKTKVVNQAVKRNLERFPQDFMFKLTKKERDEVVTVCDHLLRLKFSSTLPYVFTEHGVIMAANVLNTPRAIEASVFVVRAFVKLRETLATHKEVAYKLSELERKFRSHDVSIQSFMVAIRRLMKPPEPKQRRIGFRRKGF